MNHTDPNIHATIKEITWINMLGSIAHQNSVFIIYLLEDEQDLSLGMLDTTVPLGEFLDEECSDPTRMDQVSVLKCHPWIGMLTHTQ